MMGWPEWAVVSLTAVGVGMAFERGDGKRVIAAIIGATINMALLYAGGFFS